MSNFVQSLKNKIITCASGFVFKINAGDNWRSEPRIDDAYYTRMEFTEIIDNIPKFRNLYMSVDKIQDILTKNGGVVLIIDDDGRYD